MKKTTTLSFVLFAISVLCFFLSSLQGCEETPSSLPLLCKEYKKEKVALFGDLHIHTKYSFDAWAYQTNVSPQQAYDFAKGKSLELTIQENGKSHTRTLQLTKPLDFAAVTDHSELLGEVQLCNDPQSVAYQDALCKTYREKNSQSVFMIALGLIPSQPNRLNWCGKQGELCINKAKEIWKEIQNAANQSNDSSDQCKFTSFIGYEYTATTDVSNLHRNVIFRNDKVPDHPLTYYEYNTPSKLLAGLEEKCLQGIPSCDVISIPHNFNLSNGKMYQYPTLPNQILQDQQQDAKRRSKIEVLMEMFQHKGDMECRFEFSQQNGNIDPYCHFEKQRKPNPEECKDGEVGSGGMRLGGCLSRIDFARNVLLFGLLEEQRLGTNPFQVGFIGSTDTHNGIAGYTLEHLFQGHIGSVDNTPEKILAKGTITHDTIINNPGGLAVVWAEQKTRDSIFSAFKRRETYATSGTRIQVRTFAGFDLPVDLCNRPDATSIAMQKGVPMGGNVNPFADPTKKFQIYITASMDEGVPSFLGTPLQQVQVIKGWIDSSGKAAEKVFVVAGDANNGASVELSTCKRVGKGEKNLCTVWSDPDFDPKQRAFYYVRVLENPSCRWSTYLCNQFSGTNKPENCTNPDIPKTIQERAWTSPIWYSP